MLKGNKINPYPSIYVIGAQKSGTTTLYSWLNQDKRFQFPKIKETHYFSSNYHYGKKWYLNQFNKIDKHIRCEVDPSYMFAKDCIQRIVNLVHSPKFIIILRKPIERSYSHYLMSKYRGYEKFSFIDALNNEQKRLSKGDDFSLINYSYLKRSEYSVQINSLLKIIDENNCFFINFDDLFYERPIILLKKVYKFIGLDFNDNININIKVNSAKTYKSSLIRNLMYSNNIMSNKIKKIIPFYVLKYRIKSLLDKINSTEISGIDDSADKILKSLPEKYIQWNNKQVFKTKKITNLKLNNWII